MKIKLNSWHYWLANYGLQRVFEGDRVNFCEYCRYVLFGLINCLVVLIVGAIAGFFVVDTIFELYQFFAYGTKTSPIPIFVIGSILFFGTMALIANTIYNYQDKRWKQRHLREPEPDGFFSLLYQKIKTKTCFTVEIEES